jgi:hypothetical protein
MQYPQSLYSYPYGLAIVTQLLMTATSGITNHDCVLIGWLSAITEGRVRVRVTLRLALYCQSVLPGAKPLEGHDQRIFSSKLNPCSHSPYVTPTLARGWFWLLWIGFAFVKCTYRTCNMLLKILPLHYIQDLRQSRFFKADHDYLTYAATVD